MEGKRMTWKEIKEAYPNQVVGLAGREPDTINFETAIVKYNEATTPYKVMAEKAFDGEIFMIGTKDEDIFYIPTLYGDVCVQMNGLMLNG